MIRNGVDCTIGILASCTVISSIFSVSLLFPDMLIDAKYYFTCGAAIIVYLAWALRCLILPKCSDFSLEVWIESTIWAACSVQAIFFMLQKAGICQPYNEFGAGSFENVAGLSSCLSFSLLMGWNLLGKMSNIVRFAFYVSKAFCISAIVWSQSRTGILCVIAFFIIKFWPKNKKRWAIAMIPLLGLMALFCKVTSSKGRWFILQSSYEMICKHPWFGWGKEGFIAHYMDIQADFFTQNPQSEFTMIADNIHHPLNEWVAIIVDYGIVGAAVITIIVALTIFYALKHKNTDSQLGVSTLAIICIFSLFSYPFQYPFTWLALGYALCCIYRDALKRYTKKIAILCLCGVIPIGYNIFFDCMADMKLKNIQDKVQCGLAENMLTQYESLYPNLKDDKRFLYYYATALFLSEHYREALKEAKNCQKHLADYELSLFLGDIFRELNQKDSTLFYYRRAHYMCPVRLTPLYEIYQTYKFDNDTTSCIKVQKLILHKRIKIKSKETECIIQEIKNDKMN